MLPEKSNKVKTAKCSLHFGTKTFFVFFDWRDFSGVIEAEARERIISVSGEVDTNDEATYVCVPLHMCRYVCIRVTAPGNNKRVQG